MYDTEELEAVGAPQRWVNIHNPGDDFRTFLDTKSRFDR